MQVFHSTFATRRYLKLGLTVAGAIAGAVCGIVFTRPGRIVAGAPPATLGNYAWNVAVFGVMAGIISPLVTWTTLRRVPLWRTVGEPLAYALAGGATAVVLGAPVLLLVLAPVGIALGFARLARRYPDAHVLPLRGRRTNAAPDGRPEACAGFARAFYLTRPQLSWGVRATRIFFVHDPHGAKPPLDLARARGVPRP